MFKIKNIIKWSKNRMDTAKEWISWKIRLTLLERRKKKRVENMNADLSEMKDKMCQHSSNKRVPEEDKI